VGEPLLPNRRVRTCRIEPFGYWAVHLCSLLLHDLYFRYSPHHSAYPRSSPQFLQCISGSSPIPLYQTTPAGWLKILQMIVLSIPTSLFIWVNRYLYQFTLNHLFRIIFNLNHLFNNIHSSFQWRMGELHSNKINLPLPPCVFPPHLTHHITPNCGGQNRTDVKRLMRPFGQPAATPHSYS